MRKALWTGMLSLALACGGGGGKTDVGMPDEGPGDLQDVPGMDQGPGDPGTVDDGTVRDLGEDPGQDISVDEGTTPVDPGGEDVVQPPQDVEDTSIPPLCPCDETIQEPVCWVDGQQKTEFRNDRCAKCALCAPGPDCVGCTGTKPDCVDIPAPNYISWKGSCSECPCRLQDECDLLSYPACGKVCADKGGVATEYQDLCAMKADFGCYPDYSEFLLNFGVCQAPACEPCLGLALNPVCGSDGKTYRNQCELVNCPSAPGVTRTCLGACVGQDFCPGCPKACSPVCGDDGVTYGSECAATTCGTKGRLVQYPGPCCPECDGDPMVETCATDGHAYPNLCVLLCQGKQPCGDTGPQVCGNDGRTWPNLCWANCKGNGQFHAGACTRLCETCAAAYTPVCATSPQGTPQTYASDCYKTCLGGTGGTPGQCGACTAICGTIDAPNNPDGPVCGEDGITYPSSCFPQKCLNISWSAGNCT